MNGASTEVFRSSSQPVSSGSSAGRGNGGEDQLAPTNRLSPQFSISASDESSEIELFTTSSKRRRTDASDEEKIELSEDDPESNKDLSGGSNFAGVERISADREAAPSPVASSMEAAATAPAGAITPQDSQFRLSPRKHRPPALPSKARGTGDDPIPIDGTNDTRYESDETKDTLLEFGSPVFAPYPGKDPVNEEYFWGRVTKKWRKHGHRRYSFDIRFHDGDVLRGIGSHFLHRMREVFSLNIVTLPPPLEYRNLWKVEDGPAPPVSAFEADGSSGTLVNMQTESLEGLFTNRCRKCSQCNRPSCGACIGCRFNETNRRVPRHICVQTMCVDIPRVNKCQTSPWLPPDWSYYFEENQSNPEYEGLFIFRPKFMKSYCYKSYETAQSTAQTKFKGYNENHCFNFYREVGLRGNREELLSRPTTQNEPMHLARIKEAEQMSHTVNTGNKEWKHQKRCRKCWRCNRSRCKNCSMCRSGNHLQFGCIRNNCINFLSTIRTTKFLPTGWTFFFSAVEPHPNTGVLLKLDGIQILAPDGNAFDTFEEAMSAPKFNQAFENFSPSVFYSKVGLDVSTQDLQRLQQLVHRKVSANDQGPHCRLQLVQGTQSPIAQHPLLGRPFRREWLRDNLRKVVLTGKISGRKGIGEEAKFTVAYSPGALSMVLSSAVPGLISPSQQVSTQDAWDGCLCSYDRTQGLQKPRFGDPKYPENTDKWLVPESASREVLPAYNDQSGAYCGLPVLRLEYNGFYLKLSVKRSNLPGVKLGVFLSVTKAYDMDDLPDELTLKCGELLDLGVYGPLRFEDIKSDDACLIKSLIHKYKNESYVWDSSRADTQQTYFDITDDHTGDLHTKALCRVHPFVNEISNPAKENPSVVARIDPEGAMHYLLGHSRQTCNPELDFVFLADGSEREILTDYGKHYEIMRLREGYPRKRMSPESRSEKLLAEEEEYVTSLYERCLSSGILWFVRTYKPVVSSGSNSFSKDLVFHVLVMFYFMKHRACLLQASNDPDVPQYGWAPLIAQCHDGIEQGFQLWTRYYGSPEDLFRKARDRGSSTLFPCVFSKTNPGISLDSLDVKSFLELFLEGDLYDA